MQKKYIVGGIIIETEIDFPELITTSEKASVFISYGKAKNYMAKVANELSFELCSENVVLLNVPGVALYLIEGNSSVIIDLYNENSANDAKAYVFTLILGVLSYTNGFFPLHGGGVVYNGEAYLFAGRSGAGKSTTVGGLMNRGFNLLADDLSNLFMKDGRIYVHPCFPRVKLWKDSLKMIEYSRGQEYLVRSNIEKYLIPVGDDFVHTPVPVKRIYFLRQDLDGGYHFKDIMGLEKFKEIKENGYKPWMVKIIGLVEQNFMLTKEIIAHVEFKEFLRPFDQDNIEKMFEALIIDIKEK